MAFDKSTTHLPSLYELIELQSVDSVVTEARRRAENGAEEGTLIWAHEQTDAHGRLGKSWYSPFGNLYCAIILQPEFPAEQALQISYIAAISMGTALGSLLSPLVTLRYRWPNDIVLNDDKAVGIVIDAPAPIDDRLPWMSAGIAVNIAAYPNDPNPGAVSVHEAEGNAAIGVTDVLEEYSKQFLHWINRWAEHGFEPVLRAWQQRTNGVGEDISIDLKNELVTGTFTHVETDGSIAIKQSDGRVRNITLRTFYDLP